MSSYAFIQTINTALEFDTDPGATAIAFKGFVEEGKVIAIKTIHGFTVLNLAAVGPIHVTENWTASGAISTIGDLSKL